MTAPTLPELRTIIKAEGLKIIVKGTADPIAVLAKIEAKRAKIAGNKSNEGGQPPLDSNNAGGDVKKVSKGKKLLSVTQVQKIIDEEGINLRITFKLRKNLARLNEVLAERREEA